MNIGLAAVLDDLDDTGTLRATSTLRAQPWLLTAPRARPAITNRNPDNALTDTARPFPSCARAEESSHYVH
jgi:hypothetical protein